MTKSRTFSEAEKDLERSLKEKKKEIFLIKNAGILAEVGIKSMGW